MLKAAPIASAEFVMVKPDGSRAPLRITLAAPYLDSYGTWACRLSLDGLYDKLGPMGNEDSLQALGLAWNLAKQLLAGFVKSGGRIEFEDGQEVPLAAYFGD